LDKTFHEISILLAEDDVGDALLVHGMFAKIKVPAFAESDAVLCQARNRVVYTGPSQKMEGRHG